jgi:predicted O-methyltransferase YrrM
VRLRKRRGWSTRSRALAVRWSERAAVRFIRQLPRHAVLNVLRSLAFDIRREVAIELASSSGSAVQAGPFAGCRLSQAYLSTVEEPTCSCGGCWYRRVADGDFIPKLFGFYESELSEIILRAARSGYDGFINIGAGDGYYAIGFASIARQTGVIASETCPAAQSHCRSLAEEHGLSDRIRVVGILTPEDLESTLRRFDRAFILSDCEGYEKTLLDLERAPSLARTDILVECHDFIDPNITSSLISRLQHTHSITKIEQGARDPNSATVLKGREDLIRWLAVCEFRPNAMHWLYCTANQKTSTYKAREAHAGQ